MKLRLFREDHGLIQTFLFIEEEKEITSVDEMKSCMKKIFSAMKKNGGYSGVSCQICSDAGYYMVIDRYDVDSEAFQTTFCEAWNSKDVPTMKSQKNILAWAIDVLNSERSETRPA